MLVALCFLVSFVSAASSRTFTVVNRCTIPIRVFFDNDDSGLLHTGRYLTGVKPSNWSGEIYTNSVLSGSNGAGPGMTRAVFNDDIYYIIRDLGNDFNVGITIAPFSAPESGLCGTATCTSNKCRNAITYGAPPLTLPNFSDQPAPTLPFYACRNNFAFRVTFCPKTSDGYPGSSSNPVEIHPNGNPDKCLDVRGANFANGTLVQIYDCNGTPAQQWTIVRGTGTSIQAAGTTYCLDAGSGPQNRAQMGIWQCFNGRAAQAWDYTNGDHIELSTSGPGGKECLDLTDGNLENWSVVQIYQCLDQNTNQVWTTVPEVPLN